MERDEPIPAVDDYVEHLAFTAVLGDGTRVRIRPIAPKDRQRVLAGWEYFLKERLNESLGSAR